MNGYQGQIRALDQEDYIFPINQDIVPLLKQKSVSPFRYIKRLGVTAPQGTQMELNGVRIDIGKTGIYEAEDLQITSFKFLNETSSEIIIDYIIEI